MKERLEVGRWLQMHGIRDRSISNCALAFSKSLIKHESLPSGVVLFLAEVRRGKAGHKIEDRCMNPCHGETGQQSSMYCHLDWNYCKLQPMPTGHDLDLGPCKSKKAADRILSPLQRLRPLLAASKS
ncbi:hypothetical protein FQN54_002330 [Arachnomyces sp. PD_36]|nr:hypothetical protein FQN54_002330 [Arachnomyces sp. PD_36]